MFPRVLSKQMKKEAILGGLNSVFPYCRLLNPALTSEHVPSLKCSIWWVVSFKKNLKYKYASRKENLELKYE